MAGKASSSEGVKDVVVNRKARHDYFIEETIEAGIALTGSEVKSLRAGKGQLKDSYARIKNGEAWLVQAHISEYTPAARFGHDPTRPRKLLLHKREIVRLASKVQEKGLTLVPLRIYFKRGKAKVELGLAKGKKLYDKRATIREREAQREIARAQTRRR
jgi:SsrA-binding protein